MSPALRFLLRGSRIVSLVLLAALGTTMLVRYAPGYFSDSRELDAVHAGTARSQLQKLQKQESSLPALLLAQCRAWTHGDLGQSRQYDLPVGSLLGTRYIATVRLLSYGLGIGWLLALATAVPLSMQRRTRAELLLQLGVATLMAIPIGALATFSLLLDKGGPVLTLALLVAVREFKLLYALLLSGWRTPHLFYARAQGFSGMQSLRVHLLQKLRPELLNLAGMSAVVALSALVPVEVIFDVPGLGQLAWSAAINRDLPVLVTMTALMAACVAAVGLLTTRDSLTRSAVPCE